MRIVQVDAVLKRWIHTMGTTPADLARRANLSRATVYTVLANRPVSPETLRKLAEGLARDDDQSPADPATVGVIQRELYRAGGFENLLEPSQSDSRPSSDLIDQITRYVIDPILASRIAIIIRGWQHLESEDRSVIVSIIQATYSRLQRHKPDPAELDVALDLEANVRAGAGQEYIRAWHHRADIVETLSADIQAGLDTSTLEYRKRLAELEEAYQTVRRLARHKTDLLDDVFADLDDQNDE